MPPSTIQTGLPARLEMYYAILVITRRLPARSLFSRAGGWASITASAISS
jgi:hypothetical protein